MLPIIQYHLTELTFYTFCSSIYGLGMVITLDELGIDKRHMKSQMSQAIWPHI